MNKFTFMCSVAVFLGMTTALQAAVTSCEVSQLDASGRMTVTYALDADAIVTCEMLVDGTPVEDKALLTLFGDVNRRITAGNGKRIFWHPSASGFSGEGSISARLTAWPLDNPPDFMAVDLTVRNSRRYYASVGQIPFGITNGIYKTDILLMRKIPAAGVIWRMGQPYPGGENCSYGSGDGSRGSILNNETGHMVSLTNDYYAAVYMTTRAQYRRITGKDAQAYKSALACDFDPVAFVSYNVLRGESSGSFRGWPQDGHQVLEGSVVKQFRDFTGIVSLDLPTEAEWEYACRAGTGTSLNSGKDCSSPILGRTDENMAEVGWMQYNEPNERKCNAPMPVGLLKPNNWNLYDCHGNLSELCLDWWSGGDDYRATFAEGWEDGAVTVAPVGPDNADGKFTTRSTRSGSHFYGSSWSRSASRILKAAPDAAEYHYGFRLFCRTDIESN
jgi:formylglycine-generating enzyme required for sulfatase activity